MAFISASIPGVAVTPLLGLSVAEPVVRGGYLAVGYLNDVLKDVCGAQAVRHSQLIAALATMFFGWSARTIRAA